MRRCGYGHAECRGYRRDASSYFPETDNVKPLARKFGKRREEIAELRCFAPIAVHDRTAVQSDAVAKLQQQRYSHLCSRKGSVFRDVCHDYTARGAGIKVHYVISRGKNSYVFELWQL